MPTGVYVRTEETRRKLSLLRKGKPFPNWGGVNPKETGAKISISLRGKKRGPLTKEHRELISEKLKGKPKTKQCRELLSLSLKGRKHSEERIQAIINGVSKSRKRHREMSKPEARILDVLQSMYGKYNPYKYTGQRKFWIDIPGAKLKRFKNPDFTFEQDRKIIEVFGRYWHQNDDPELLIADYKSVGWDCFVVWEDETGGEVIDQLHLFTFPYEYWKEYYECHSVSA